MKGLVADTYNNRVQVFEADGTFLSVIGSAGSREGQLVAPESVVVDALGNLYVVDTGNSRIQKFVLAASGEDQPNQPDRPKAIIVAGSGPYKGNAIWDATETLVHRAYSALGSQGFAKEQIRYLTATALGEWLQTLQASIPRRIVAVLEACKSGSFLPKLGSADRILLFSAAARERAQLARNGTSFSYYFWNAVARGGDLRDAFELARDGVDDLSSSFSPQTPQADGDGDGYFAPTIDLQALEGLCVNRCTGYATEPPSIQAWMDDRVLDGETDAQLWAKVDHLAPLLTVDAQILPPDRDLGGTEVPLAGLPIIKLAYNPTADRWEGRYDAFEAEGDYLISFRASDENYELSLPRTAVIAQNRAINACTPRAEGWVQKAYVAYYGRPADPGGLDYWACRLDDEGGELASVIDAFGNSAEYDERFGGLDSATLIDNLYRNLFNRAADPAGLDWYSGQLDSGAMNLQGIALNILGGARNLDVAIVASKLEASDHFTRQVRAGCPYGAGEIEAAVELLSGVDAGLFAVDNAKGRIDAACGL